jgi:hypothetical protein
MFFSIQTVPFIGVFKTVWSLTYYFHYAMSRLMRYMWITGRFPTALITSNEKHPLDSCSDEKKTIYLARLSQAYIVRTKVVCGAYSHGAYGRQPM